MGFLLNLYIQPRVHNISRTLLWTLGSTHLILFIDTMHGTQPGGSGTMIDLQCQLLWPHIFTRLITSASVIIVFVIIFYSVHNTNRPSNYCSYSGKLQIWAIFTQVFPSIFTYVKIFGYPLSYIYIE